MHITDILLPLLSLVSMGVCHILINRMFIESLIMSFLIAFMVGGLTLLAMFFILPDYLSQAITDRVALLVGDLIIYLTVSYTYINFVNIGNASVRIKILDELSRQKAGLKMEQFTEIYNAQKISQIRVNRLLKNDQLELRTNKYHLGKVRSQILLGKFMIFLRKVILGSTDKVRKSS